MKLSNTNAAKQQRVEIVMAMLRRAAKSGDVCPSNIQIMNAVGASSISVGANTIQKLEDLGLIRVRRTGTSRQVFVVDIGKSTASVEGVAHWSERGIKLPKCSHRDGPFLRKKDAHAFRGDLPSDRYIDRTPCGFCGVRADVGCRHSRRLAA